MSNHQHNNEEIGFSSFLFVLCFFAMWWWIIKTITVNTANNGKTESNITYNFC